MIAGFELTGCGNERGASLLDTSRLPQKPNAENAGDQVALKADPFCFRRYAMKQRPQKPRIIIAQVDGSGTAATAPISKFPVSEMKFAPIDWSPTVKPTAERLSHETKAAESQDHHRPL
jgi:hypothetical protein